MKKTAILIFLTVGTLGICSAQKMKSDSVDINLERAAISKELMQLRDSINVTIKLIDIKIVKAPGDKKEKLETDQKELVEYRNRVKFDLQETSLTAKNAWTTASVDRIRTSTNSTRREYNRIRKEIK
ncbi:MAG: hypothetical protein HOP08_14175 [Cyclobacteriaceae bacterium]|nr:hypothetical protein [Cyclobacteriaceae bacterium]